MGGADITETIAERMGVPHRAGRGHQAVDSSARDRPTSAVHPRHAHHRGRRRRAGSRRFAVRSTTTSPSPAPPAFRGSCFPAAALSCGGSPAAGHGHPVSRRAGGAAWRRCTSARPDCPTPSWITPTRSAQFRWAWRWRVWHDHPDRNARRTDLAAPMARTACCPPAATSPRGPTSCRLRLRSGSAAQAASRPCSGGSAVRRHRRWGVHDADPRPGSRSGDAGPGQERQCHASEREDTAIPVQNARCPGRGRRGRPSSPRWVPRCSGPASWTRSASSSRRRTRESQRRALGRRATGTGLVPRHRRYGYRRPLVPRPRVPQPVQGTGTIGRGPGMRLPARSPRSRSPERP